MKQLTRKQEEAIIGYLEYVYFILLGHVPSSDPLEAAKLKALIEALK